MSTTAIARREQTWPALSTLNVMELGTVLAKSGYFKDARDASQAVVKVLFGQEIGVGPVSAMMGIHIIEGKPSPSANLMAARVKASGRYDYRVQERSPKRCALEFFEKGPAGWEPLGVSEWTLEDAKAANLLGKNVWKSYPRNMLFSRAMSDGVRTFCPDLFGGAPVYTGEELGVEVDAEGVPIGLPAASTQDVATDAQLEHIGNLKKSSTLTEKEVAGIERRLGNGMTRQQASDAIEWLQDTIKFRKDALREEAAATARTDETNDSGAVLVGSADPDKGAVEVAADDEGLPF